MLRSFVAWLNSLPDADPVRMLAAGSVIQCHGQHALHLYTDTAQLEPLRFETLGALKAFLRREARVRAASLP